MQNFNKLNRSITWITFPDGSSLELSGAVSGFQFDLNNNLTLFQENMGYEYKPYCIQEPARTATMRITLAPGFRASFWDKPKWYKRFYRYGKQQLYKLTAVFTRGWYELHEES
jgi:hypothetical protein